ncbi:uncharacterized protein ACLA_053250 [Aspergillus clavatus NRRL 1]|uniref:F-box domain-containing protein n=1 Tax=Aspergillus clavatus (strain ATCC 1007 / CBS 513.65 / DSM 816 / NCTC 3887 / NRRL 1 / QM 1276 / 107) TaxID=344612 RepID=A1CIZ6_ASPCL|nr:uncharacterized protein ACLA_053250 [Aspergillus clavatus NRRL 1]EAW10851.1 hypothetical protein ACLA_053250 [Aspergillus clavatus NRRL 1]
MAATLPYELLAQIVAYLQDTGIVISLCTTVYRQWQVAFEPLIYSKLNVYSAD